MIAMGPESDLRASLGWYGKTFKENILEPIVKTESLNIALVKRRIQNETVQRRFNPATR